jgi:hypothetical protein
MQDYVQKTSMDNLLDLSIDGKIIFEMSVGETECEDVY